MNAHQKFFPPANHPVSGESPPEYQGALIPNARAQKTRGPNKKWPFPPTFCALNLKGGGESSFNPQFLGHPKLNLEKVPPFQKPSPNLGPTQTGGQHPTPGNSFFSTRFPWEKGTPKRLQTPREKSQRVWGPLKNTRPSLGKPPY